MFDRNKKFERDATPNGSGDNGGAVATREREATPPPPPPAPDMDAKLAQLSQLGALRDQGVLSDAEFEAQKARILA